MSELTVQINVTDEYGYQVPPEFLRQFIAREGGRLLEEAILNPEVDPQGALFFRAEQLKEDRTNFGVQLNVVRLSLFVSNMKPPLAALGGYREEYGEQPMIQRIRPEIEP